MEIQWKAPRYLCLECFLLVTTFCYVGQNFCTALGRRFFRPGSWLEKFFTDAFDTPNLWP